MSVTRPKPVIPEGLSELLHNLSFSVIKERPKDIISFAAEHFLHLSEERERERLAAKKPKEELILDADTYAWRENYFTPKDWQVMPDPVILKGGPYQKYGEQFRITEEDEERKRLIQETDTKAWRETYYTPKELQVMPDPVILTEEERKRLIQEPDTKAWRETYYSPKDWQVMPDPVILKGSVIQKYGGQFRIAEEDKERKRLLESSETKNQSSSESNEEVVNYQVSRETTSDQTTKESEDQMVTENKYVELTSEGPIQMKTEECEKDTQNDSQTNDTGDLSSNPDPEKISIGSSENLSTED